jgi:sortase A
MPEGVPKFRDFFEEGKGNEPVQLQGAAGSAGAIPAVKPFNFGRDPGGPEDKTLYITVPKIGLQGVPAYDEVSEEALEKGTAHIPATGYPWQEEANVYVAGHRLGYPGTGSDRVFYDLDQLVPGDEIFVTDSAGTEYAYRVIEQIVVPPDNVEVMNPVPGKSLLSLQTCTLPDYADRIVVQAELV